jgi:hypothetical protein
MLLAVQGTLFLIVHECWCDTKRASKQWQQVHIRRHPLVIRRLRYVWEHHTSLSLLSSLHTERGNGF